MADNKDPFSEFGGSEVKTAQDPFAEFGGETVKKKEPTTVSPEQSTSGSQTVSEQQSGSGEGANLPPITLTEETFQQGQVKNDVLKQPLRDEASYQKGRVESMEASRREMGAKLEADIAKQLKDKTEKEKQAGLKEKLLTYLKNFVGEGGGGEPTVTEVEEDLTPIDPFKQFDIQIEELEPYRVREEGVDEGLRKSVLMQNSKLQSAIKRDKEQLRPILEKVKTQGDLKRLFGETVTEYQALTEGLKADEAKLKIDYENARKVNEGKLQEMGFLDSFGEGIKQTAEANEVANALYSDNDERFGELLEQNYTKNFLYGDQKKSDVGQLLGGQALPIGVTLTAAVLSGGNPALAGMAGTGYYARMGAGSEAIQVYNEARSQGKTHAEAVGLAKGASKAGFVAGGLEGALGSTFAVGELAKGAMKLSKPAVKAIFAAAADAGVDAGAAVGAQYYKNIEAIKKGIKRGELEGLAEEGAAEAIFGLGFQMLSKGAGKLKTTAPKVYNQLITQYGKISPDITNGTIDQAVKSGDLSPDVAQQLKEDLGKSNAAQQKLESVEIPEEKQAEIVQIQTKIDDLEAQKENASPAVLPAIEKQIEDLSGKLQVEAAIPLTAKEKTELNKLQTARDENKAYDKDRLKVLEKRQEAAKKAADEKKEAAKKAKEEEDIKRQQEEKAAEEQVVEQPEVVSEQAVVETPTETVIETTQEQPPVVEQTMADGLKAEGEREVAPAETVSETTPTDKVGEQDTQKGIKAEPQAETTPEGVQNFEAALTAKTAPKKDKALKQFGEQEALAKELIENYDTNLQKLKDNGIEPTGTKAEVLADMLSGKYDEVLNKETQPAEQVNIDRRPTTMPDGDDGVELFAISQDGTEKSIGKFYADDTTEIEKAERNYRWGQEQKAKRPQQATEVEVTQPTGDKVGKTVAFEHAGGRVSGVVVAVDEKGNLKVEGVGTNKGTKFTVKPTELYGEVTEQMVEAETKNKELEEKIKTRLGKKKEPPKGDKLMKSVIGSQQLADIPNRLVQNWLAEKVRGLENYVAKTVQKASVSDSVVKRNIADFITSLSRGIMDTQEYSQAKRQKLTGEIGKAKLDVEDFHADLWDLIGGDINSADRVHQVLDPEVSGTGLKYDDLTDAEKDLHDLLRDLNDYTHNQNFLLGKISQETYDKYKDKYIGRDYVFDDKPDQTIGGRSIKEVLGIYKQRKDLDQAMKDAAVKDPIYLTLKRYLQTAQNKAIADYSDWIFQNHGENNALGNAVFISDTPKDGFIKLGKGYGALSNKYVARNVAEDFGSFVFNNEFMSLAYDAFKAYDGLPPRQFMKELLTVGNPQVQLGNWTSNIVFSWLGGVDFPTYISKSLEARKQIKERGDVYRFLTDEGLLGSDFISKDLKPMETVIGGEPTTAFGKARKKLRSVYSGVDDAAKIQMFLSLKDMGYTDQQAVTIVFESMQNYQNTGRIWDFASKTPIIGNSFVKFTPEMLRLLKNGMTRRPLHTLAFISMLSTLPSIIGKNMGDDDEEIDAAAKMKGIPKITIPYTDLNIPLSWRIGDKRVNLARFLMPMYIYDIGGESRKATEFVNKFMPYQLKETETGGLTPFNVQDPFVAPIISILQNKDFRDKPIVEETDNSFDATLKRLRHATRGYGGFYANMIDDIFSTSITGEDFYGRRKTALDVALNTLIKVETFDDERLKQGVIREFDGYERMTDKLYRAYTTKRKKIDGEVKEIKKDKTLSEERKKELIAMKQQDLMRVSSNVLEEVADVQKEMIEATEFYRNLSRKQKYSEISGAMSEAERTIKNRMRKIDGKFVK